MTELNRRAGRIVPAATSACLIAATSALAILWQGDFSAPPRYDGAGYAVLARALMEGHGYRAIDHPDRPRHAHFPPGYPALLALVWGFTGYSASVAHLVSCVCTVVATLAAWWWFRRLYPPDVALVLGLALAVNWVWARTGSAIQSEPLFELLGQVAILAAGQAASRGGTRPAAVLGGLLAACLLTRPIALGLAFATLLDLWLRRRRKAAMIALATMGVLVSPWIAWVAAVGTEQETQAGLLLRGNPDLRARLLTQSRFYLQRIPDQLTGPAVEFATIVGKSERTAFVANVWAAAATSLIVSGWITALRRPRRRLAGLVPLLTLILLLVWPYTEAGRFLIPLVPCLLIGATEGLTGLCLWASKPFDLRIPVRRLRLVLAMLCLCTALVYSAYHLLRASPRGDASDREFDAACAWLARNAEHPGRVLTRHPGEVFLATGRQALEASTSERPGDPDAQPEEIARLIARYQVAYLLIDEDRYLQAAPSPLSRFVAERPDHVRQVWSQQGKRSRMTIYEVTTPGADDRR
jgi:hypothetical protein